MTKLNEGELFTCSNLVRAWSMNRLEYNKYRGWILPDDEDGSDEGYLIESLGSGDGGASSVKNHPDHEGHISWLPVGQFNSIHKPFVEPVLEMQPVSKLSMEVKISDLPQIQELITQLGDHVHELPESVVEVLKQFETTD